jgi:hypothetical protein
MDAPEFVPNKRETVDDLLKKAFKKGSSTSFRQDLRGAFLDPLEPPDLDGKTKPKWHPLIWPVAAGIGAILAVVLIFRYR